MSGQEYRSGGHTTPDGPMYLGYGAFEIQPQKKPIFHRFFAIFSTFFPNIWPLAGPNIAKKGGPLQKLARGDRQTHFGTFDFWLKPGF